MINTDVTSHDSAQDDDDKDYYDDDLKGADDLQGADDDTADMPESSDDDVNI